MELYRINMKISHFVLFLLVSCTRSVLNIPNELIDPDVAPGQVEGKSIEGARNDMARASVSCEGQACASSVAVMTATFQIDEEDPDRRYFVGEACTASLVSLKKDNVMESYFLTAGHCIPKRFRENTADCASDISFIMPDGKRLACEKVMTYFLPFTNDKALIDFDFALIKAKGTETLKAHEFSQSPLNVKATSYPVSLMGADIEGVWANTLKATLKVRQCFYEQRSFILPNLNGNPKAPLFVLRGCGVQGGYSGGTVLDGGTVIGMISFTNPFSADAVKFDGDSLLPLPSGLISVASNVACFDPKKFSFGCDPATRPQRVLLLNEDWSLNSAAYMDLYMLKKNIAIKQNPEDKRSFAKQIEKLEKEMSAIPIPRGFKGPWTFRTFNTTSATTIRLAVPYCYLAPSKAKAKYDVPIYSFTVIPHLDLQLEFAGRTAHPSQALEMEFSNGRMRLFGIYWSDSFVETDIPRCQ